MTRPADWTPVGYASDPVPGDPNHVDLVGRMYIGTADSIHRAVQNLQTALDENFGQAETIDAIREVAGDVADRIERAQERYRGVGDAMVVYAPRLRTAQTDSANALQRAIDAQSSGATADRMVAYYQDRIDDPATPPANLPALRSSLSTWEIKASAAEGNVGGASQDVADAIAIRDAAAAVAIQAIREVENSGDLNDSGWDDIVQWVQENKEAIDLFVEIVGWIATAVMVIALFIPGLNVIVGAVALIAAAITLLNTALQVAAGTMGPVEAILNVGLAVLTFVGGRAIASSLKAATANATPKIATSLVQSFKGAGIRGMTTGKALNFVNTTARIAVPGNLPLLQRLAFVGLDLKQAAGVYQVANIVLKSGATTAAGEVLLGQLTKLGIQATALEAGSIAFEKVVIGTVSNIEQPLPWRAGDNW